MMVTVAPASRIIETMAALGLLTINQQWCGQN
jgi:hypothetical protein